MNPAGKKLISDISGICGYTSKEETYSPFFSNIGLEMHNSSTGIGILHLHYGRSSRPLFEAFADFPLAIDETLSSADRIVFSGKNGTASLAFFDTDCFVIELQDVENIILFQKPHVTLKKYWFEKTGEKEYILHGYSFNSDRRDPDECVPVAMGIRAGKGLLDCDGGKISVTAENSAVSLFFSFNVLEISEKKIKKALKNAPSVEGAARNCLQNIASCISDFSIDFSDEEEAICSKAVQGLLFNLARAPGRLSRHISAYPNRGTYPTHFLWDTCFQNLAYEELSLQLAKDFLLQFADTQRCDGKIEQFLCPTWGRPEYSQPPLIGWAVLRIAKKDTDINFLKKMLAAIERNTEWWFCNRMTPHGVIFCPHGLETGQDDSPRFDSGPTLACDMNAYLLNQMRASAEIASILGQNKKAEEWNKKADKFAGQIVDVLYNEKDNIFYDAEPETGKQIKLISCSSLLPLWAGVPLDREVCDRMISTYLLSDKYFYGAIPFPSVSYAEKCYTPEHWWRGPTWMPIAYLLTELLKKYSYDEQYVESVKKLHDILLKDPKMHELFNSQTGEGLGSAEQGWTCAIFIRLCKILSENR